MSLVHPLQSNFIFCWELMKSKQGAKINWADKEQSLYISLASFAQALEMCLWGTTRLRFICLLNLINNFALLTWFSVFFTFVQIFEPDN